MKNKFNQDYQKFMFDANNQYVYQVNEQYDVVVEIANISDQLLKAQVDLLIPAEEKACVF